MTDTAIYNDIATRTGGDIYVGVVGPVRSGKSTLIQQFMEALVLPHMESEYQRERAVDELPQSAAGRTIMTTEPKFIPEEAVEITLSGSAKMRVRMIDCVGYIVPSALGYIENEMPRMVRTPWFEDEVPFNLAAEIGTQKVISEHSTIGLVVTTDGSISDIPRSEYEEAEERVVFELQSLNKPYVVLLNSRYPNDAETLSLAEELSRKYNTPVMPVNCRELSEEEIRAILAQVLYAFPVREISVEIPKWVAGLPVEHPMKQSVFGAARSCAESISHIREVERLADSIGNCDEVESCSISSVDLGSGKAVLSVAMSPALFYEVLSDMTGFSLASESDLLPCLMQMAQMKKEFEKFRGALEEVNATGYGIVMPTMDELQLEEPEIMKQGGKYGVRLRASAPSIHMMRADITTEVSPVVGSEKQSEELVHYLLQEFEEHPKRIWESNIFGKSLHELVNEGLHNKLYRMPPEARLRLQETVERIINEGCNGLLCIIL